MPGSTGWPLTFSSQRRVCGRTESVTGNRLGQPGLWPYAISGDLPIVLVRLASTDELGLAGELLRAHAYWRRCGLVADLIFLNDAGPPDELQHALERLIQMGRTADLADKPGGVFLKSALQMPADDVKLLEASARAILHGDHGVLAAQLDRAPVSATLPGKLRVARRKAAPASKPVAFEEALSFANGLGGFTPDGREYVVNLHGRERPPAPWSNVLANPDFGCLITESGAGYTWAGNAQLNRLTPWSNDPVADPAGEATYLRDEETGEFWSPTPGPCGGDATTVVRHGQGYTRFNRMSHGLEQELVVLVHPVDPIKLFRLKVKNAGDRPRRLSATFYAEWVLGVHRDQRPAPGRLLRSTGRAALCWPRTPGRMISPDGSPLPMWGVARARSQRTGPSSWDASAPWNGLPPSGARGFPTVLVNSAILAPR